MILCFFIGDIEFPKQNRIRSTQAFFVSFAKLISFCASWLELAMPFLFLILRSSEKQICYR